MDKTGTPASRDDGAESERRRELVLAAGRLFSRHGYERTTVRELAKACCGAWLQTEGGSA